MLDELLEALQATEIPFALYMWESRPAAPYGLLSLEGGADTVVGDNTICEQVFRGSVDLFMRTPDLSKINQIQCILNDRTAWQLNSVQFEDDTGLLHYEWLFEVVNPDAVD